ncbi:hypothetical protein OKA05_27920 [Luteolibacter arcticus]|uniref:Uncharacterized protein n=1 Tax=Luteolibacter arcticus TaxID=1581411 RepID=A0ABT3GSF0_9BACT|nr:hypothetical protein [Luteolibacter arcticus]
MDALIKSGNLEAAWKAIDDLPPRLRFTSPVLRQRLRCALAMGWERRARMLEEVLSNIVDREPGSAIACQTAPAPAAGLASPCDHALDNASAKASANHSDRVGSTAPITPAAAPKPSRGSDHPLHTGHTSRLTFSFTEAPLRGNA